MTFLKALELIGANRVELTDYTENSIVFFVEYSGESWEVVGLSKYLDYKKRLRQISGIWGSKLTAKNLLFKIKLSVVILLFYGKY